MRPKIGSIYYYTSKTDKDLEELFLVTGKQNKCDWIYYTMPLASSRRLNWSRINIYMKFRKWKEVSIEELPLYIGLEFKSSEYASLLKGEDCYASRFLLGHNNADYKRPVASHK